MCHVNIKLQFVTRRSYDLLLIYLYHPDAVPIVRLPPGLFHCGRRVKCCSCFLALAGGSWKQTTHFTGPRHRHRQKQCWYQQHVPYQEGAGRSGGRDGLPIVSKVNNVQVLCKVYGFCGCWMLSKKGTNSSWCMLWCVVFCHGMVCAKSLVRYAPFLWCCFRPFLAWSAFPSMALVFASSLTTILVLNWEYNLVFWCMFIRTIIAFFIVSIFSILSLWCVGIPQTSRRSRLWTRGKCAEQSCTTFEIRLRVYQRSIRLKYACSKVHR